MKKIILTLALAALPAVETIAADASSTQPVAAASPGGSLFEFSAETFAAYTVRGDAWNRGVYGAGVAANVFYGPEDSRFVGLKLDSVISEPLEDGDVFVDYSSASLVLRLPAKVSPYALAGGGRDWLNRDWNWHAGAGVSVDLTRGFYLNAEWRNIFEDGADSRQIRVGGGWRF